MNNTMKYSFLALCLLMANVLISQDQRVIRDVVLLDKQPFEVLMSGNGDILSKVRPLPNYLTSNEQVQRQITASGQAVAVKEENVQDEIEDMMKLVVDQPVASDNTPGNTPIIEESAVESTEVVQPVIANLPVQKVEDSNDELSNFEEYYEIEFVQETATLNAKAIKTLNELAIQLNNNPNQRVQVFGFQNEAPIIAMLLSKRRRDACLAYLRIKGVRVDRQIKLGSITKGENNKIVFGLE